MLLQPRLKKRPSCFERQKKKANWRKSTSPFLAPQSSRVLFIPSPKCSIAGSEFFGEWVSLSQKGQT